MKHEILDSISELSLNLYSNIILPVKFNQNNLTRLIGSLTMEKKLILSELFKFGSYKYFYFKLFEQFGHVKICSNHLFEY